MRKKCTLLVFYKALYTTYRNGKAQAYTVNVYQKLIVVKNIVSGIKSSYILNLIPDADYDKKYLKQVGDRFINCGDKGGFSGVAFYTIPNLNRFLCMSKYENGVKIKKVFLSGKREQLEAKVAIVRELLGGIVLVGRQETTTRSFGEDDWEYTDWDDNFIEDWEEDGGWVEETEDGWLFIDENGDWFLMEDSNEDGDPDSVVVTPEYEEDYSDEEYDNYEEDYTEDDYYEEEGDTGYIDPDWDDDSYYGGSDSDTIDNSTEEKPKSPAEIAEQMNNNTQLIERMKEVFLGVFQQPNSLENGWIRDCKSLHAPNKQTISSIKFDWSMVDKSVTEWYHSHPGGGPIPSFADLKTLTKMYLSGYINTDDFSYGVISDFGCTSLIITSMVDFESFANRIHTEGSYIKDMFNETVNHGRSGSLKDKLSEYTDFLNESESGLELFFNNYDQENEEWKGWMIIE